MKYSGKLELTWVNKDKETQIEPRILIEKKEFSYGDNDSENLLIHGDNLIALKALESVYFGKVKAIYIDPPYNTGYAFKTYDDGVEHSIWLSLMRDRLTLLKNLLREDGFIFIQIDDNEQAYLKVLCDEIFGRKNFITSFIWLGRAGKGGTSLNIASQHEYILCYGISENSILKKEIRISNDGNYSDEIGKYKREQLRQWGQADRREDRPTMWYPILAPDGTEIFPYKEDGTEGRWRVKSETCSELLKQGDLDIVNVDGTWRVYRKIRDGKTSETAYGTILDKFGTSATGTAQLKSLFGTKVFDTPKPEELIRHLIFLSTEPGDYVLDSFLGSGTTIAVAHKMKRKWIGIELGNQAYEVCVPRMKKVINGEQGGISGIENWHGGGGYKFYELAEPLLVKNPIIPVMEVNPSYTFEMVCEAICKIESFTYAPSDFYHGYSTENRFIHVTMEYVNGEYVSDLVAKLNDKQSLIIYCLKHQKGIALPDNVEIKRIPKDIQEKCNFESDGDKDE